MSILSPQLIKTNLLSGLTVALAMVPEAIAFALVAQVSPLTGLYAAFIVALITSAFGGRPGMISGAAGALAVDATPDTTATFSIYHHQRDITPFNGLPTDADGNLLDLDRSTFTGADWNTSPPRSRRG